jgi:hypothetical protein
MKEMISLLLSLLVVSGSIRVRAQQPDNSYLLNLHTIGISGPAVKAVRDFWKREGGPKQEKWYKGAEGYLAEFEDGDVRGKDFYDKKGSWSYSIRTFGEKGLPEDIRRLVRSAYFDDSIFLVKEVREGEALVYIVDIEDSRSWKELLIQDGEMREWKEYSK